LIDELSLKPDLDDALVRWQAFWAGEIIDRPCVAVRVPKGGDFPWPSYRDRCGDVRAAVEKAAASVENFEYLGEAVPYVSADLGPDQYGAWLGGHIQFSGDSGNTNWIEPFVDDWRSAMPLRVRWDGEAWQKTVALMEALADAGAGRFLVGMLDLHSNFDALSAMRSPCRLSMDIYDEPGVVREAARQVGDTFVPVFERLETAGKHNERGYIGWIGAYSPTRYAVTQCDYACMLSREMFVEFVLPELRKEWSFLDHTIYHYDGVTALQHLPAVLAEPDVDAIQWVPGAGNRENYLWDDLMLEIQRAGKGLHVAAPPEQVRRLHGVLRPERVFYDTWCDSVAEAESLLDWLRRNT